MTPSLDGPLAKLNRAGEHLKALYQTVRRLQDGEGYAAVLEIDPETGDHLWRMKVDPAAPMRLGVLVGDVAHNLRSCLDHLAWQLALITKPNPYDLTEFPIYRDAGPGGNCYEPRGREKIRDVPEEAEKLIESIQPYHRANPFESPLWILHHVNIRDKHRLLFKTFAKRGGLILHWDSAPQARSDIGHITINGTGAADDGDVLLRVPSHIASHLEEERKPDFLFQVTLDLPQIDRFGPWYIYPTLQRIHDFIRDDLLPKFQRFFTTLGPGF